MSLLNQDIKFYTVDQEPTADKYEFEPGAVYLYSHSGTSELYVAESEDTVHRLTSTTDSYLISSADKVYELCSAFPNSILRVFATDEFSLKNDSGALKVPENSQGVLITKEITRKKNKIINATLLLTTDDQVRSEFLVYYNNGGGWNEGAILKQKPDYALNADQLTYTRTISLTGAATGSVTFDGSADVEITTTLFKGSHSSDLNSCIDAGQYFVSATSSTTANNSPFPGMPFILTVVFDTINTTRVLQRATTYGGNACKEAVRTGFGNPISFSAWSYSVLSDSPISLNIDSNNNVLTHDCIESLGLADRNHASSATTYGVGTQSAYGHVKINNGVVEDVTADNGVVAGMDHSHKYAGSASVGGPATKVASEAGTANADRHVWFSNVNDSEQRVHDDEFKYNPSTNTLLVDNFKHNSDPPHGESTSSPFIKGFNFNNASLTGINGLYIIDGKNPVHHEGIHFGRMESPISLNEDTTFDSIYAGDGRLRFAPERKLAKSSSKTYTVFHSGESIIPASTNSKDIGSDSNKWKNVYATTFHGTLTGNADTATKLKVKDVGSMSTLNSYVDGNSYAIKITSGEIKIGSITIPKWGTGWLTPYYDGTSSTTKDASLCVVGPDGVIYTAFCNNGAWVNPRKSNVATTADTADTATTATIATIARSISPTFTGHFDVTSHDGQSFSRELSANTFYLVVATYTNANTSKSVVCSGVFLHKSSKDIHHVSLGSLNMSVKSEDDIVLSDRDGTVLDKNCLPIRVSFYTLGSI